MLKIITSLTMFATGLLAQAQTVQTRNAAPFSKIEISSAVEVIYTQSDQPTLKVETTGASELKNIVTEFKNNTLRVYRLQDQEGTAKVYVTAPGVAAIKAASGSKFRITNQLEAPEVLVSLTSGSAFWGSIKSDKLQLNTKSGAVVNIRVDAGSVNGVFKSGSKANISGNVKHSDLRTQTGALCNARNLMTDTAMVNAQDNSSVLINTKGEISVTVADNAKVTYFGKPSKVAMNSEAVAVSNYTGSRLLTEN